MKAMESQLLLIRLLFSLIIFDENNKEKTYATTHNLTN